MLVHLGNNLLLDGEAGYNLSAGCANMLGFPSLRGWWGYAQQVLCLSRCSSTCCHCSLTLLLAPDTAGHLQAAT